MDFSKIRIGKQNQCPKNTKKSGFSPGAFSPDLCGRADVAGSEGEQ